VSEWVLVDHFLAEQRVCFPMPQVARRRAAQLGNVVAVLKFGAIDLDHRCFHRAGSCPSRSVLRKETCLPGARRGKTRKVHLVDVDDLLDRLILEHE
jgi:hypothetical protein